MLVGGEVDVAKTLLEVDDELALRIGALDQDLLDRLALWLQDDLQLAADAGAVARAERAGAR